MRTIALRTLILMITVLTGCFSSGMTDQSDDSTELPQAVVEIGEVTFEEPSLPKGCFASVEDLPSSALVTTDDPRLLSDRLIVVNKQDRRVMLFSDGKLRHDRPGESPDCWRTALGVDRSGNSSGTFDKSVEGDRRTPEGWFHTSDKPSSQYYGAIRVHYPGERHAKQALNKGRISNATYNKIARAERHGTIPPQNTVLGGEILVHGGGSSADWTWGCIALNNHDLDELRGLLPTGMKTWILILP